MIDSSRHFLPLNSIYQTLDAMEMNKLNVLHWHLSDDQSFPYESRIFPELSQKGAYLPRTHVYHWNDVSNVIEYARIRGIRVIPEFDTPGHTNSWGHGHPEILTQCYDSKTHKPKQRQSTDTGLLDVTLNSTYKFMEQFFNETIHHFPEYYIHVGGDEVNFQCWASNPAIQKFMVEHHFGSDTKKLLNYYLQKLFIIIKQQQQHLNKNNNGIIVWQELFDDNMTLPNNVWVHVWKGAQPWHKTPWEDEMKMVPKRVNDL